MIKGGLLFLIFVNLLIGKSFGIPQYCFDEGAIYKTEIDFLWTVFNCTNGANWTNNQGWNFPPATGQGPCDSSWYGVICTEMTTSEEFDDGSSSYFVSGLDFYQNGLSGVWPSGMLALNITFWDISYNNISGSLPWIAADSVAGSSAFGMQLEYNLFSSWLHPFPPNTGGIAAHNNEIAYLASNVLTNGYLDFSIALDYNRITELPEIGPGVRYLSACCQMAGALRGGLQNVLKVSKDNTLSSLTLSENPLLGGQLPQDFSSLPFLQDFSCGNCGLTGTLKSLATAHGFRHLLLNDNKLTGPIPSALTSMPFNQLNLSNNPLSGSFPDDWVVFKNVTVGSQPPMLIAVENCGLTGSFPLDVCQYYLQWSGCDAAKNNFSNCASLNCCQIKC